MTEFFQGGWWTLIQTIINCLCYYAWWRIGRMREAREALPIMANMHRIILAQQHALEVASTHIDNLQTQLAEAQAK